MKRNRLLIVDFDKSCLDFFTGLMKKRNSENYPKGPVWRVLGCDSGCGALNIVDCETPTLALVELKMRDVDGIYLVRSLALRGIPVYVSSSQEGMFVEAIRAGAKLCLKKPLDAGKFLTIIKEYENGN